MNPTPADRYLLRRKILILSLFTIFFASGTAAQTNIFTPGEDDPAFFTELSKQYEQAHKTDLNKLSSPYKKDLEKIYEQRWKHIAIRFSDKEIYAGKDAQQYLDGLTEQIITANPHLRTLNFKCYFSRSGVPNASYIGQGIILFNMGLFEKLNNESEAVFILSHEIAHFVLRHSENSMDAFVKTINSEEVQNKLRNIKGSTYGKGGKVDKLVNTLTFDSRRHSRNHEDDADSMAIELMRNTNFDPNGAISTLHILDQVDKDSFDIVSTLHKTFNAKEYPFKKRWLAKEEGLLSGHAILKQDTMLADSLKTHPDCTKRIASLQPLISKYQTKNIIKDDPAFLSLQKKFRYEIINYSANNNYTRSLYYALKLLEENPNDAFLVAHTGSLLNNLYSARKTHTMGKKTDLPAPYYTSSYNTLLQFVQNLYIEDITAINYYFLAPYSTQFNNYNFFNKTFKTATQLKNQP